MEKYLISISEACSALGLGRTSIYNLINRGSLDTVTIGNRRLVRLESVRRIAGEHVREHGDRA